jgi:hypothetical protein
MTYTPIRSGFTGPSAKIGGSTDYHIDLKLLQSLPVAERVKAVDALAKQYQSIGREIEFSNQAVSGQRWDLNKDLSDKVDLLERAASAHSHSRHPGWQSLDFYVPFKGKSRFDKGAVEDASIFLPGVAGGKVRRGSGGGYGYYSESLDPSGKVLFRVGHGNIDRPEKDGEIAVAAQTLPPQTTPPFVAQTSSLNKSSTDSLLSQALLTGLIQNQASQNELLTALTEALGKKEKPKTLSQQLSASLVNNAISQALNPNQFLNQFMNDDAYLQGSSLATGQFLGGNLF